MYYICHVKTNFEVNEFSFPPWIEAELKELLTIPILNAASSIRSTCSGSSADGGSAGSSSGRTENRIIPLTVIHESSVGKRD